MKQKITIFFLITGLVLMSGYFVFPKKAEAASPVWVTGGNLQVEEMGKALWDQLVNTMKATLTADFTRITSLKDIWEKMHILLSEQIHTVIQNLLEQLLMKQTNDIFEYIRDEDLRIQDYYQYYKEEETIITRQALRAAAEESGDFRNAPEHLRPIYRGVLDSANKDDINERIECNLSAEAKNINEDFTWEGWNEYWLNPACNPYGAVQIALDERAASGAEASKTLDRKETSTGFKDVTKAGERVTEEAGEGPAEESRKVQMPASSVKAMYEEALFSERRLTEAKIADLTDAQGAVMPYIRNLIDSLLSKLMNQGSSALDNLSGPSSSWPNAPMPPSIALEPEKVYSGWTEQDLSGANELIKEQKLLSENLTTQYLSQQQTSLNILLQIKDLQKQALYLLKDLSFGSTRLPGLSREFGECSLPSWAEKTENGDIVKVSAINIGSITFNKKTKEIIETTYQVNLQIDSMNKDIQSTQQNISEVNLAVSGMENFISALKNFINQPTEKNKQDALAARSAALKLGQKAVGSSTDNLFQLNADTQSYNIALTQKIFDIETKRGFPESPQAGTLYGDISDLNSKISDLNSRIQRCIFAEND